MGYVEMGRVFARLGTRLLIAVCRLISALAPLAHKEHVFRLSTDTGLFNLIYLTITEAHSCQVETNRYFLSRQNDM